MKEKTQLHKSLIAWFKLTKPEFLVVILVPALSASMHGFLGGNWIVFAIIAIFLTLFYIGLGYTKGGRRIGLLWLRPKFNYWSHLQTPRNKYRIYSANDENTENERVFNLFNSLANNENVKLRAKQVLRRRHPPYKLDWLVERWQSGVAKSEKIQIFMQLYGSASGWAQIHPDSVKAEDRIPAPESNFILGLESCIIHSPIEESAATHELMHAAQEGRDGLLTDEWKGKVSWWRKSFAEIEAHYCAPWAFSFLCIRIAIVVTASKFFFVSW